MVAGLGATVPELGIGDYPDIKTVDKVQFSMCTPEIVERMKTQHPDVSGMLSFFTPSLCLA